MVICELGNLGGLNGFQRGSDCIVVTIVSLCEGWIVVVNCGC